MASAVQRTADRKNSLGRGKNETNIVWYPRWVRGGDVPLYDRAHLARGREILAAAASSRLQIRAETGIGNADMMGSPVALQAVIQAVLWQEYRRDPDGPL